MAIHRESPHFGRSVGKTTKSSSHFCGGKRIFYQRNPTDDDYVSQNVLTHAADAIFLLKSYKHLHEVDVDYYKI